MKKLKISKPLTITAILSVGFFLMAAGKEKDDSHAALQKHLKNFSSALAIVEEQYAGEIELDKVINRAIQNMLQTLDAHSSYATPKSYNRMQEDHEGSFSGIGISISIRNQRVTVLSPIQGGPSYKLGIRSGDIIDKINGKSTIGITLNEAVSKLRGPEGEQVKVSIRRAGLSKPLEYTIIREKITENAVPYAFMVNEDTGYIKMIKFSRITEKETSAAIESLNKQGMKRLILDLRDNPGGLLSQAISTTNLFIGDRVIVSIKGRDEKNQTKFSAKEKPKAEDLPLVVLINNSSASGSEILAGAIQDYDRGILVGKSTFGKGLVQSTFRLSNGGAMFLTTARYYTPSGRLIQREYSGIYDYYVDSRINENKSATPKGKKFTTSLGRPVYSGQGVSPDVSAEGNYNQFIGKMFVASHFFNFANEFVTKNRNITKDLKIDDKIIGKFKDYLKSKKFEYKEEDFRKNIGKIKYQLANNIFRRRWDSTEGIKHALKYDAQFQKGMSMFDRAVKLLSKAKKKAS